MEAPLTLFVWSKSRILPVRLTDFSITEEAFDPNLNPIRAKVSLGMRVLTVNDLGFDAQGRQPVHGLPAAEGTTRRAWARRAALERASVLKGIPMSAPSRTLGRSACRHAFRRPAATSASDGDAISRRRAHRHLSDAPLRAAGRAVRLLQMHIVVQGERLDNIAAQYLGDPELSGDYATPTMRCDRTN